MTLLTAHSNAALRCLNCAEHGAQFDGPCDECGYADPRWSPEWEWYRFNDYHAHIGTPQPDWQVRP